MLGDDKPRRELDETSASAARDRLDEIIAKVKAAGGEVTKDTTTPLVIEFNNEMVDIGTTRMVEFNINKTDFQITHEIRDFRVGGGERKKHLERVTRPMIVTKLKRKPELSDQWTGVDIDDFFD